MFRFCFAFWENALHLGQSQRQPTDGLSQKLRIREDSFLLSPLQLTSGDLMKYGCALVVRRAVVSKWVHLSQMHQEAILSLAVKGDALTCGFVFVGFSTDCKFQKRYDAN